MQEYAFLFKVSAAKKPKKAKKEGYAYG